MRYSTSNPSITVLSGSAGETPVPGACAFSVSMAMVNMLVKNTALEVGHLGIRVNAVAPGFTDTKARESKEANLYQQLIESQTIDDELAKRIVEEQHKKMKKEADEIVPLAQLPNQSRINQPDDVAKSLLWLGSDDASFITGEILVMDGGQSLTTTNYFKYY
jgi:NAD(P)-dependent dehydrogenase (short-subunit alcohol dehydrogenase family)